MNTKDCQPQKRGFLQMSVKTLSLFVSILVLGSFTTSHAQKRSILLSPINFEQGCPSLDESVVQVSIDGVQMASRGTTSISPGPRPLSVTTSASNNLTIKEIIYEDVVTSGGKDTLQPQPFTPNSPNANVSITVSNTNTSTPARLTITVACGAAATPQRLPIIFLPGVGGTKLHSPTKGNEVWPQSAGGFRMNLRLNEDGITQATPGTQVFVGDILRRPGLENFYGGMMKFIESKGYKEGKVDDYIESKLYKAGDLFAFPYDWRLDLAAHLPDLDKVIDNALQLNPSAKKVILLAHSMGGLIAKAYINSSLERAAKVDSLITIGTPYWGSPKPYYGVVSGYNFGNPTVREIELMKILAQTFPSAYQLMPTYPFIEDATNKQMLSSEKSRLIKYKEVKLVAQNLLFGDTYQESKNNDWFFKEGLVKLAQAFHERVGTKDKQKPLLGGVKHYVIIGVGVKTLAKYSMRAATPQERFLELDGRSVVLVPVFSDGDGTVPLDGSEISTAKKDTYYIPYVEAISSEHGELPKNATVLKIVGEIIAGNPPDANQYPNPHVAEEKRKDLEPGVDFTLHSDAHLSITDRRTGGKLGFNNQGGMDEDLPTGTFLSMEGVEYASIADIDRTLGVTVTGIQDGRFTLDVNIKRPGGAATQFSYREVPVKKGTIAQVTLTPGQVSAPPPLTVTTDGRTTTVPASIGVIPPDGVPPVSTAPIPAPPSSGGIGGTWATPSGDTITLTQDGDRVTGTYRGILGTGTLSGTFDGRTLTGTIEGGQAGITVRDTFSLRLTPEGRLEGRFGSSIISVDVILTRRP